MVSTTFAIKWALFIIISFNGEMARVDKSVIFDTQALCNAAATSGTSQLQLPHRVHVDVICVPEFYEIASIPGIPTR